MVFARYRDRSKQVQPIASHDVIVQKKQPIAVLQRLFCHLGQMPHFAIHPQTQEPNHDDDGGPLVQRPDDKPETIRERFKIYTTSRDQIVEGLGGATQVHASINANQQPAIVQNELLKAIQSKLS